MSAVELRVAQRRGTAALAGRETRRVIALWTQTVLPPVVMGILFLAVFGGALGERIDRVEGLDYLSFILPGLLVSTVAAQALANTSTSLFQAKNEGYVEDLLTSPLRGWQVAAGYVAGGALRGLLAALVLALVAVPFADIDLSMLAAGGLVLTALLFAALGVVVGVWADTFDQHALVANLLVTPLALVAGVFYSAESLAEPWRSLTQFDPIYYLVDTVRGGFTGVRAEPAGISLAVAGVIAIGAFCAAGVLLERGWRLKP